MTRGDCGLQMIGRERVAGSGHAQMLHAARDHRLVPGRTVLLVEPQNVAF